MIEQEPDWQAFGMAIMQNWPAGDVDGGELQDLAEKFNIILPCEGGFDPDRHSDDFGVCPEKGDPWYMRNYGTSSP